MKGGNDMKNIEYYKTLNEKITREMDELDYHVKQAQNFKKIYELTSNKSGFVNKLLNKWAIKENGKHVSKGTALALNDLVACNKIIIELSDYQTSKES